MNRHFLRPSIWPIIGLSLLLTVSCLVATVYIYRLHTELGDSLRADAARLQTAQQAQIQLREFRFHTVLAVAGPNETRRKLVADDRKRFDMSLATLRQLIDDTDDIVDLSELQNGWDKYSLELERDLQFPVQFETIQDFSTWADTHSVSFLLVPCGRLVERAQNRMSAATRRSERQTTWAGRCLLLIGVVGPLAGILGGYTAARSLSRRVARLFVRLQDAQSHFDHDVGAITLVATDSLQDLEQQLAAVVERVGSICRRLQEQERDLLRAEQLAAVGNLAAGVAHEVRNPLTGIKMMVEAAVRSESPSPLTRDDLHLIRDEIIRLERTVQGLLDYAKPPPSMSFRQDIRPTITRAIAIVAAQADRVGVKVESDVATEPLMATFDPDQFISLLTNLLINALDATPPGGLVQVEAMHSTKGGIIVTVSDTGPGIPAEISATLFTPFASNKRTGTGLGLVVARRIATDHGGTLTASHRLEGGACFILTLPAVEDAHAEVAGR